jgi:YD repeat-containing protein
VGTHGQLTNQQDANGSGTVLNNYTYTYDAASNVKTEVSSGTTTTYSYNAANELTSDGANSYSYDLAGNRTMTGYQTAPATS